MKALNVAGLFAASASALTSLQVIGNQFVNPDTGDGFQIIGLAYQPGGSSAVKSDQTADPLSDRKTCLRDAALLQMLGVNAIRVYNLVPDLNHDECASIFNFAGIYMVLDVNSPLPGESINSLSPETSYHAAYLKRTFAVVEAFKDYPNTLAFISGNEVLSDIKTGAKAPPFVRAVTRDLKNYIAKHASRKIPVGYAAADVRDILFDTFQYLQCALDGDANDMSRADLFSLNSYSWCGHATFESSGYNILVAGFSNTSVPVLFCEYGCNEVKPRLFTEIGAIYGPQMTDTFSGGFGYEYSQEPNDYGLVELKADGSATLLSDFNVFKSQIAKLDQKAIQSVKARSSSPAPPKCDASLIKTSGFSTDFKIPILPPGAADIIDKGISPKPSGSLVKIDNFKVELTVFNTDNTPITDLAVKPVSNDDNASNNSSSEATTSGGSSAQAKSEVAKRSVDANLMASVLSVCLLVGLITNIVC